MTKVAFIGLGVMGGPMAGHLSKKFDIVVYNRDLQKTKKWLELYSGQQASSIADAVKDANIVLCCLGNDQSLEAVLLEPSCGAIAHMQPNSILVDHTTASADIARRLEIACSNRQIGFIDAPVSGGQAGAENGVLTIMCGGDEATFKQILPAIDCYAKRHALLGVAGAGQLTKMVNQICIAGIAQGLSEAMHFGMQANLPMDEVLETIGGGAAQSWQMDNRGKTMCRDEFDFGFAVDWMRKDLNICLDTARTIDARLPLTALVNQFYGQLQDQGHNRSDTSSLVKLLHNYK